MDHATRIQDLPTITTILNALDINECTPYALSIEGDEDEIRIASYNIPTVGEIVHEYNTRTTVSRWWRW